MYDIYSEKEQDPEKIINLCLKNNSHLHKSLFLKKISNHNFGFFLKEKIEKKIKVMGIPKKLFIPKEAFTNYLLGKKFDYVDKELLDTYMDFLPKLNYFKDNHFLFFSENDKKIVLSFFNEGTPLKNKIKRSFDQFDLLSDYEKYIDLLFKSRSFTVDNEKYLLPMLDLVNFEYTSGGPLIGKEDVFFKSNRIFDKNEEFFQKYNTKTNPIFFFINYGFFPEKYFSCFIPKNFLLIPSFKNEKEYLGNGWTLNNQNKITNENNIVFENLNIPEEFIKLMDMFKINNKKNYTKEIFNLLINEINLSNLNKYLESEKKNHLLIMFAKSVNQHHRNILQIFNKIDQI